MTKTFFFSFVFAAFTLFSLIDETSSSALALTVFVSIVPAIYTFEGI